MPTPHHNSNAHAADGHRPEQNPIHTGAHGEIHFSRRVYLETFGCQMNELDSELVRGNLTALGYQFVDQPEDAGVILYNTCSVREHAEQKVWSRVGMMGRKKAVGFRPLAIGQATADANSQKPTAKSQQPFILGVIGCMAEREGASMMRRFPQIDLMCGPGELDKLPMLIDNALKTSAVEAADRLGGGGTIALQGNNHRRSSTLAAAGDNLEMLDLSRAFDPDRAENGGRSAYVRITRGCNKFCTFCVVPYTRGAEVHRAPQAIIDECQRLADAGVIEITLLGQTVNHYHYVHGTAVSANGSELPQIGGKATKHTPLSPWERAGVRVRTMTDNARSRPHPLPLSQGERGVPTTSFADLLYRIHEEVPAIQRLRFVTSYPRDFSDDALHVMRDCPRICRYLHVPAQSGSNRILKLMNRGYSVEEYLEFIDRARAIVPDVCIAGDIIVGFPTESDDDFELTKNLMRRVGFKNNFIFKYSPRPGTTAMQRFEDDVPDEIKRRRNNQLLALQAEISAGVHAEWIGREVDVFVERISRTASRSSSSSSSSSRSAHAAQQQITINGARAHAKHFGVEVRREGRALNADASRQSISHASPDGPAAPSARLHQAISRFDPQTGLVNTQTVQISGRTGGDLIVVFDHPSDRRAGDLIGRIVRVEITGSAPLLLKGTMLADGAKTREITQENAFA